MAVEIRHTDAYARWFRTVDDRRARAKINVRIRRLSLGNHIQTAQELARGL